MSKKIEFMVIKNEDDAPYVVDTAYLKAVSLSKEELVAVFGERAKEHMVVFKPQNFAMKREINQKALVVDLVAGWKRDPDLIPAAQAAVVVDHWSFDTPVSVEGFGQLDYLVGEYISAAIQQYLYPDLARDPDFFAALTSRATSSEVKTPEPPSQ